MAIGPQLVLLLVVLTDFAVLGTTRLSTCIRALAAQGLLLGALPVLVAPSLTLHAVVLAAGTVAVKAVVLPRFLTWAIREAAARREVEPVVGFNASLLLGAGAAALAFAIAARLPLERAAPGAPLGPAALTTGAIGLLVPTTRREAVPPVVGLLSRSSGLRVGLLVAMAAAHARLVATLWLAPPARARGAWRGVDALGLVVLALTSLLFVAAAVCGVGYLRRDAPRGGRIFVSCL